MMRPEELFDVLRGFHQQFVSVSFRPTAAWHGSILHAQGRLRHDVVDQPEGGIAFGIGKARRINRDWAEVQIMADEVEAAEWRDDLVEGRSVFVISFRDGGLLTFVR